MRWWRQSSLLRLSQCSSQTLWLTSTSFYRTDWKCLVAINLFIMFYITMNFQIYEWFVIYKTYRSEYCEEQKDSKFRHGAWWVAELSISWWWSNNAYIGSMSTNLISGKLFWRNLIHLLANRVDYSDVLFLIRMFTLQISDTFDAISYHRIGLFNSANFFFVVVRTSKTTYNLIFMRHLIKYLVVGTKRKFDKSRSSIF